MTNIITACFGGTRFTNTRPAWLIDHGMVLQIKGVELPETYFVDFANSKAEQATRVLGNADGVVIPDQYFLSNAPQIFAWVYLTTGDSGFTTLQITIPLSQRPDVTDEPPTPQETSLIEQAIAALNDGVERAETAADDAEAAVENVQQTVNDALQAAKASGEFDGTDGVNGVTFTPDVDAAGNISWTNDGGLPNPQTRNIKGPKGDKLTYADLTAADKADLVQGPIADAQTAAVNAVNSKGEEVIQSIPSDYTELSEDVDDLKSALGQYVKVEASAYKAVEFSFVANKKYIVKVLSGTLSLVTRETPSGQNIERFVTGRSAGYITTFVPTQNASYFLIETTVASSVIIGEYDSSIVLPLWNDSEIQKLDSALANYIDVIYYNDYPANYAIILTNNDVSAGTVIQYDFTVPTGTATFLDILDTNNTRITYIGKSASSYGDLTYKGEYAIPDNFGSIEFKTTASPLSTHILLTENSKQKDLNIETETILDSIDIYTSPNIYDKSKATAGYITNGYGDLELYGSAITTDYMEAKPGDIVRFLPFSANIAQSIFVFDSEKNVISGGYYPRTDYVGYSQITMPIQGKYFRCNIYFRDQTEFFVTINTPYNASYAGQFEKYITSKDGTSEKSLLFGKKITYNGDSICEGRYYGNASNGGAYANLISIATGCYAENRAISGGILASAVPEGQTDPNRKVVLDIENMAEDADLICFEGGYNDYAKAVPLGTMTAESDLTGELDTTTISGALESIFRQAQTRWLGKPICFVIVHKVQGSYYTSNSAATPYTFKDVHDRIIEICNKYAIPYYDACLESGLNGHNALQSSTYLTSNGSGVGDGTHPNEAGYKRYYVPQLIALFESILPRMENE